MQTDTIKGTARAVIALAANARQLADQLSHHKRGSDAQRHAALHCIETALRDCGIAIRDAEAALPPSARSAIGL
jgi:hypothetical protein